MAPDSSERFVLLNQLAEEFAARYRRGERPVLQEYIDRYPHLADNIREFFPAVVEMEQVKDDRRQVPGAPDCGPLPPLERCMRWARRNPGIAVLGGVLTAVLVLATVASLLAAGYYNRLRLNEAATAQRERDALPPAVRARPPDAYLPPRGYVCYRASGPVVIDGKLDDEAWTNAPWTDDFVDIEGDHRLKPRFRTRVKMLWDDKNLYIGAELEEPHVQGTYTQRDSYIFHEDNDFEVFLNPDGNNHKYAELEMNALNTVWDLRLKKPYRDGGKAEDAWDIPGLKTAVHVNGTLNNPRNFDKGWTIEIAIPWDIVPALNDKAQAGGIPRDGDQWRINFSRVEWRYDIVAGKYVRRKDRREDNWVWSPQGTVNMHMPETWGYVQFSTAAPGAAAFRPDPAGPAKHLLHRIYYAQKAFAKEHDRYARSLAELDLANLHAATLAAPPVLEAEDARFRATVEVKLPDGGRQRWHIREDSRVWSAP